MPILRSWSSWLPISQYFFFMSIDYSTNYNVFATCWTHCTFAVMFWCMWRDLVNWNSSSLLSVGPILYYFWKKKAFWCWINKSTTLKKPIMLISPFAIPTEHAQNINDIKIFGDNTRRLLYIFNDGKLCTFFKNILLKVISYSSLHMEYFLWNTRSVMKEWSPDSQQNSSPKCFCESSKFHSIENVQKPHVYLQKV